MTSREVLNKLLRISLGNEKDYSLPFSVDWKEVVALSYKEGVAALAVDGLKELYSSCPDCALGIDSPENEKMKFAWYGCAISNEIIYADHIDKAKELTAFFAKGNFRSCILKGIGLAQYYPIPSHRTCGDIDIWVEGKRKAIISYVRNKCEVICPMVHHFDALFYINTSVEVHYIPAWIYNPFANNKLMTFYNSFLPTQFSPLLDSDVLAPSIRFNLVFCLVHLYRHAFDESSSLKQFIDYYFLLVHSSKEERENSFFFLKSIGLSSFVAWVMYRLTEDLHMDNQYLLCPTTNKCRRPFSELLWVYPWKVWHLCWRKLNGYI